MFDGMKKLIDHIGISLHFLLFPVNAFGRYGKTRKESPLSAPTFALLGFVGASVLVLMAICIWSYGWDEGGMFSMIMAIMLAMIYVAVMLAYYIRVCRHKSLNDF